MFLASSILHLPYRTQNFGLDLNMVFDAMSGKGITGNKFSDLVSSWGDAMATMANSSDNLVEHFEDNLKRKEEKDAQD